MTEMKTLTGGCHCGAVRYEVEVDPGSSIECNCSHCQKKGFILAFAPRQNFRLLSGEEQLVEYRFYKHQIDHRFCRTCGTQSFAYGTAPDGSAVAAINLRCVDGVDLATLHPQKVDGRSF